MGAARRAQEQPQLSGVVASVARALEELGVHQVIHPVWCGPQQVHVVHGYDVPRCNVPGRHERSFATASREGEADSRIGAAVVRWKRQLLEKHLPLKTDR